MTGFFDPLNGPTPDDINPVDLEAEADDLLRDRTDIDDGLDIDPSPVPPWQLDGREPWERQHREPANAYAAFVAYRDMGNQRSLTNVADRAQVANDGTSPRGWTRGNMGRWSGRWRWVERARLWDEHRHAILIEEHEQQVRTVAQRHGELGRRMQALALIKMAGRPASDTAPAVTPLDLDALTPLDVVRFVRYGAALEAAALGLSTPAELRAAAQHAQQVLARQPSEGIEALADEAARMLAEIEAERGASAQGEQS